MFRKVLVFTFLILLTGYITYVSYKNPDHSYAQNMTGKNVDKMDIWISKRDNLNISMSLNPQPPVIDQNTKITFEIKKLNNTVTSNVENISGRVVIVDSDGRLFKFENQNITNNKLNINYIFPSNGLNKIILELYKNKSPFTIGSFNLNITSQPQQQNGNFFTNLFKGL